MRACSSELAIYPRRLHNAGMRLGPLALLALLSGCARQGIVHDGTSVSHGPANAGVLLMPAELPVRGDGYVIPERWRHRGLRYGTDETISVIVHAAGDVAATNPRCLLGVADISPRRGGPSAWHRSHQTGRDFDVLFYTTDDAGVSVPPTEMRRLFADGSDRAPVSEEEGATNLGAPTTKATRHFDLECNWLLVKALVDNPVADVQWIFIHEDLRALLLEYAQTQGEPDEFVMAASYVLAQPGDSLPHNDHMHVRTFCVPSDRVLGCEDYGELRWVKRDVKYVWQRAARVLVKPVLASLRGTVIGKLALSAIPFPGFLASGPATGG